MMEEQKQQGAGVAAWPHGRMAARADTGLSLELQAQSRESEPEAVWIFRLPKSAGVSASPKESFNIPVKGKTESMKEGEKSVVLCSASHLWDRRPEIMSRERSPIFSHSFGVFRSQLVGSWPQLVGSWLWARNKADKRV